MGILTKWFGTEGKIRFSCNRQGQVFEGTMYIETFNMSNSEVEKEIQNIIYVEKGERVTDVHILGMC